MSKRKLEEKEFIADDWTTDRITVQFLRQNGAKMKNKLISSELRAIFIEALKLEERLLKGKIAWNVLYHITHDSKVEKAFQCVSMRINTYKYV